MNTQGKYKITHYYDNGQLEAEFNFKDGEYDGLSKEWYLNGQLKSEKNFKDGALDGLSKNWHSNGKLRWETTYKDGEQISSAFDVSFQQV